MVVVVRDGGQARRGELGSRWARCMWGVGVAVIGQRAGVASEAWRVAGGWRRVLFAVPLAQASWLATRRADGKCKCSTSDAHKGSKMTGSLSARPGVGVLPLSMLRNTWYIAHTYIAT